MSTTPNGTFKAVSESQRMGEYRVDFQPAAPMAGWMHVAVTVPNARSKSPDAADAEAIELAKPLFAVLASAYLGGAG